MEDLGTILRRIRGKERTVSDEPEPIEVCARCHDFGWVDCGAPMGHPDFGQERSCCCQVVQGAETLAGFTLDTMFPDLLTARDAVADWISGEGPGMLLLGGAPGVGKTHLALAAKNGLLATRGSDVWFLTDHDLDARLRNSFDSNTTDNLIRALGSTPNLIIDDYGTIKRGDTMVGLMDTLINDRWIGATMGLRTLITTNKGYEALPPRMRSRIMDATRARTVGIEAPDYRQRIR